jgi:hypothetical protein
VFAVVAYRGAAAPSRIAHGRCISGDVTTVGMPFPHTGVDTDQTVAFRLFAIKQKQDNIKSEVSVCVCV